MANLLRLQTWNLRYDCQPDSISIADTIASLPQTIPADTSVSYYSTPSEVPWSTRRIAIANEILFNRVDILAVQEALHRQITDLEVLLGQSYARLGVGRDNGQEAGEYAAIFYLTLANWDTFWLSPTPSIPSKLPSAACFRSATRALFTTASGKNMTVLCTHWDHISDAQRRLAASLILYRSAYEAASTGGAVFVLGDFNSPSSGDDAGGYRILTGQGEPVEIEEGFRERYRVDGKGFVFVDVAGATRAERRSGHHATFTDFVGVGKTTAFSRIDFVMGGSNGGWTAEAYRVGESFYDREYWSSDHRPVYVDVVV